MATLLNQIDAIISISTGPGHDPLPPSKHGEYYGDAQPHDQRKHHYAQPPPTQKRAFDELVRDASPVTDPDSPSPIASARKRPRTACVDRASPGPGRPPLVPRCPSLDGSAGTDSDGGAASDDGRVSPQPTRRSSLKHGASSGNCVRWACGDSVVSMIRIPSLTELDPHEKGELWYGSRDYSFMAESEMERRVRLGRNSTSALFSCECNDDENEEHDGSDDGRDDHLWF
mmetsp:Transcript_21868/g.50394  ORF Transcript_21868/g.50394 Transcript_21868/m.50394 type:complete len:229 (+) Transcript_21868:69-755(+)